MKEGDVDLITTCPHCRRRNTLQASVTADRRPYKGCVSICWGCRGYAIFEEDLALRLPTEREYDEIRERLDIRTAHEATFRANTPHGAVAWAKAMREELN